MAIKELLAHYSNKYPLLKQFTKFCLVGGIAAVINFLIYYSFTEWLGIWYIYSAIWAFLISAVFNFIANKLWTFQNKEKGRQIINQLLKFAVVMVSGLIVNIAIIYALTEWLGFDYRLSWVFATVVITFWNFGFNRFWTFKHRINLT